MISAPMSVPSGKEALADEPLIRALSVQFATYDLVANDPPHLVASLRPEGVVVVVAGVNDFRRVDAVQTNVRVGVGEDDRVAVDHPHGSGEHTRLPVDGEALPAYRLERLDRRRTDLWEADASAKMPEEKRAQDNRDQQPRTEARSRIPAMAR
jgi:hypothetical protein